MSDTMRPPAIWFPTLHAGSGADVFTERLVAGLRARDVRAEIAWLPHHAEYAPWSVPVIPAPKWANIIHINTWLPPRFIPDGLPVVATALHCVHDPALTPYKNLAQSLYHKLWIKAVERQNLERAARVISISEYSARQIQATFGTTGIHVVPIGIDPKGAFQAYPAPDKPHKPFRLLFVGNWSARKGADLLAPIMQTLGMDFELWVRAGLRSRQLDALPPNIKQIPRCENETALAQLYRQCDALLFPSRLEGFGMVALEAQACGLPVIATNGSALPEVVKHGISGFLCKTDQTGDFASAIRLLAADRARYEQISLAARQLATSQFSEETAIDKYLNLYQSLLSPPRCGQY
ncbi:glycosyltransferase family 4 protein [Acidihalobacter prosperus]|nr:glycosyltransferase family 4 protein [Acidihalobacter prosperus]